MGKVHNLKSIALVGFIFLITNCASNQNSSYDIPELDGDTSTYLRVYENNARQIFLNGNLMSISNLDIQFQKIKNNRGIVYYSCPGLTADEFPDDSKVIALVKKYRLNIKSFTDSTFLKSLF